MTKFFAVNLGVLALLAVSGLVSLVASTGELADPTGALSVTLPAGSSSSPSYRVASIGLKGEAVFRGQVKQARAMSLFFTGFPICSTHRRAALLFVKECLRPKARATAVLDGNKSVSQVNLILSGPVTFPAEGLRDLPTEGMIPPWIMSWPSFPRRSMQVPVW